MVKESFPLSKAYQLLEPGPVVMLSTAYKTTKNVMTMSWHMMIDFEPPLVGCVVSDQNYSFNLLKKLFRLRILIATLLRFWRRL